MKSSYKKLGIFLIVLVLIILIVPGIGNIIERLLLLFLASLG
ncbi:hypothetical protein OAL54_04285 [Gammaproteobacteria bacterium]|jgi:hypothetical protein|nr:hypothetical protein [Gammaproteobacteria bacterium]